MELNQERRTGPREKMQPVNVLGDNQAQLACLFNADNRIVNDIRPSLLKSRPAL